MRWPNEETINWLILGVALVLIVITLAWIWFGELP